MFKTLYLNYTLIGWFKLAVSNFSIQYFDVQKEKMLNLSPKITDFHIKVSTSIVYLLIRKLHSELGSDKHRSRFSAYCHRRF